ncbi:toxin HicA [Clostridia bacterium]|nr:toxin HicA [Clostridia bacterium]
MPMTTEKIFLEVISGKKDNAIKFSDLHKLLEALKFSERVKGDHFIYYKNGVREIINIQPDGKNAKAYQVKQIRNVILAYKLEV